MTDEKDVLIKISYIEADELLEEFLKSALALGLEPDEIKTKVLPAKPARNQSNSTKDVKITVAGAPEIANNIISEFIERAEIELNLKPASRNEKLLGDK